MHKSKGNTNAIPVTGINLSQNWLVVVRGAAEEVAAMAKVMDDGEGEANQLPIK